MFEAITSGKQGRIPPDVTFKSPPRLLLCETQGSGITPCCQHSCRVKEQDPLSERLHLDPKRENQNAPTQGCFLNLLTAKGNLRGSKIKITHQGCWRMRLMNFSHDMCSQNCEVRNSSPGGPASPGVLSIPALGEVCSSFSPLIVPQNFLFLSGQDFLSTVGFGSVPQSPCSSHPSLIHLAHWCTKNCFESLMEGTRSIAKSEFTGTWNPKTPCNTPWCRALQGFWEKRRKWSKKGRENSIWRGPRLAERKSGALWGRKPQGWAHLNPRCRFHTALHPNS